MNELSSSSPPSFSPTPSYSSSSSSSPSSSPALQAALPSAPSLSAPATTPCACVSSLSAGSDGSAQSKPPLRVCVLDVARGYTIDATYDAHTTPDDIKYPHDAHLALQAMPTFITQARQVIVEIVYLKPDPRLAISEVRRRKKTTDVFLNLYDLADATGQQLVDFLERNNMAFTGAGSLFYDPTREELKRRCRHAKVHTPNYAVITGEELFGDDDPAVQMAQLERVVADLGGFPLFIKPEHGFDSVGIDEHSVARDMTQFRDRVLLIIQDWGSALVEQYVDGREFTVLVAGGDVAIGSNNSGQALAEKVHVFPPVEYVFEPERQRSAANPNAASFITFQDKWGPNFRSHWVLLSNHQQNANSNHSLHHNHTAMNGTSTSSSSDVSSSSSSSSSSSEAQIRSDLIALARNLFVAFEGEGYARIDVRQDSRTGHLMVLDINPNCSLFYRDGCSADTILGLAGWTKGQFAEFLVHHALQRQAKQLPFHSTVVRFHPERGFALHATRHLDVGDLVYTDEMNTLRVVTKGFVDQYWTRSELVDFHTYAWPLGPDVFAIWDPDWRKWKNINHSCDPNCWMVGLSVVARKPIRAGEELTIDYATFLPDHPAFKCWCAARNESGDSLCRSELKPGEYRMDWFIKKYRGHSSPFIEHLITQHLTNPQ